MSGSPGARDGRCRGLICTAPPFLGRKTSYENDGQLAPEARLQSANTPGLKMVNLSSTPACELDRFIKDHLPADTSFHAELRADIDFICAFLKERCFQGAAHPVRVSRVVMVSLIILS